MVIDPPDEIVRDFLVDAIAGEPLRAGIPASSPPDVLWSPGARLCFRDPGYRRSCRGRIVRPPAGVAEPALSLTGGGAVLRQAT